MRQNLLILSIIPGIPLVGLLIILWLAHGSIERKLDRKAQPRSSSHMPHTAR